ncbi:TolC family protein [Burkholderia gladioli]|uniref:TolC family protein n=1 Tax=Burkholderia gladioli TaxID=28095 RepID=UPI002445705B|nr:TolC family protein [Burkholderia gladioli]
MSGRFWQNSRRRHRARIQVSISLFEGFSRRYQVRLAQAEHDKQVASLDSARQRAALEAWSSYQALKVAFETVAQSKALLRTAMMSSEVTEKRYRLGNMLEALRARERWRTRGSEGWKRYRTGAVSGAIWRRAGKSEG